MRVSSLSLGTAGQWGRRVDQATVREIISDAIDAGCNYIDTADVYGASTTGKPMSEEFVGEALEDRHHKVLLGTKGIHSTGPKPNDWGASRYHLMNALEASLLPAHRPRGPVSDPPL
jgi:aryl-alcohol dehydrogenase-like predicted oxidoreductase